MGTTPSLSAETMKADKINLLPTTAELMVYPMKEKTMTPSMEGSERLPPFKVTEKNKMGELICLDKEKAHK